MICTKLVKLLYDRAKEREVVDVRIGAGYTAVVLDNGRCGVAYTYRGSREGKCGLLKEAGSLIGRKASELLDFYPVHNSLKSSVGLATINCIVNYNHKDKISGEILEVLKIKSTDRVGMVGYFEPLIKKIEKKTDEIFIFEKKELNEKIYCPRRKENRNSAYL